MNDLFGSTQVRPNRADVLNPDVLNPECSTFGGGRAARLAKNWRPSPEQVAWAIADQPTWTEAHALRVGESFRDYWAAKAGKDAAKLDWDATWRNWVRKEGEFRLAGRSSVSLEDANRAAGDEFLRKQGVA